MQGSVVVHAAVFTAGAVLGGGIAAVVTSRKNQQQVVPARPAPQQQPPPPVVQVGVTGKPKFVENEQMVVSPVLKYGHPGEWSVFWEGCGMLT